MIKYNRNQLVCITWKLDSKALFPIYPQLPCVMWLAIYKPKRFSLSWWSNWVCCLSTFTVKRWAQKGFWNCLKLNPYSIFLALMYMVNYGSWSSCFRFYQVCIVLGVLLMLLSPIGGLRTIILSAKNYEFYSWFSSSSGFCLLVWNVATPPVCQLVWSSRPIRLPSNSEPLPLLIAYGIRLFMCCVCFTKNSELVIVFTRNLQILLLHSDLMARVCLQLHDPPSLSYQLT